MDLNAHSNDILIDFYKHFLKQTNTSLLNFKFC